MTGGFDPVHELLWRTFVAAVTVILLALIAAMASSLAFRVLGVGRRTAILFTGCIGVPVHEMSHALVAVLFGMRVWKISFFEPDPESPQLGYVRFSFSPRLLRHRFGLFFVGIAPLMVGTLLVSLLLTIGGAEMPNLAWGRGLLNELPVALAQVHEAMVAMFSSGVIPACCAFLATAVALHSVPSLADLKQAGIGLSTGLSLAMLLGIPILSIAPQLLGGLGVPSGIEWFEERLLLTLLLLLWAGLVAVALAIPLRALSSLVRRLRGAG